MPRPNTRLRSWRERVPLSQAELAARVGVAEVTIRRWEAGLRPQPEHVRRLCAALDASPAELGLGLEDASVDLEDAGYAWASGRNDDPMRSAGELVAWLPRPDGGVVAVKISRRELLMALGVGAACAPFLRHLGEVDVSNESATALETALEDYVTVARVVPAAKLIDPLTGRIGVISAMRRAAPDPLRPRLLTAQVRYAEFLSWMHEEHGDLASAIWWIDRAADWARDARWSSMVAFAWVRKSVIATMHLSDGHRTIGWAEQAMHAEGATSGVLRFAAAQLAYGHALNGDLDSGKRALDVAAVHYERAAQQPMDELPIGARSVLDVELNWATCNVLAGNGDQAVAVFVPRMRSVEGASRRAFAIHAARLAHAHALAGNPDEACATAVSALEAADIVESATARSELKRVGTVLSSRWANRSDVRGVAACLAASA